VSLQSVAAEFAVESVPASMRNRPQWVCWRCEKRKGKQTKVPLNAKTGRRASATDSETWATFDEALAAWRDSDDVEGVGFVFSAADPFCGVDLDDCIDPATGDIEPWAQDILKSLDSYAEVSPSGKGAKIFLRARKPGNRCRRAYCSGEVEIYGQGRFFTVTAQRMSMCSAEVEDRQEELDAVYTEVFGSAEPDISQLAEAEQDEATPGSTAQALSDEQIIEKASNSRKSGDKFRALWGGKWNDYFNSASEADSSVVFSIAFYTKDGEQIDRLFRQSKLMRPKWDERRGGETYGERTIRKALETVKEQYYPSVPKPPKSIRLFKLDGIGNGERLVYYYGENVCYCYGLKTWMQWENRRWSLDAKAEVEAMAKETARLILKEMEVALEKARLAGEDDKALEALESAYRLQERRAASAHGVNDMLRLAQSEPGVEVKSSALDADPMLFNVLNGTVDLRTGELRPHQRGDHITKLAPVEYHPGASCPLWRAFLDRVFAGNQELIAYIQRAVGYSLTGLVTEQCLFFLFGTGRNGKTVFIQTGLGILGDYGQKAPTGLIMKRDRDDGGRASPDMARLRGARLAVTAEVDEGNCMGEARVKDLTGGDRVIARPLYCDPIEFDPTHKLWVYGNHKPAIRGADEGIWRRIRLVPFTVTIPEEEVDKDLITKLWGERNGIFMWMLTGCLDWQRAGSLGTPQVVADATSQYRQESDRLGEFLEELCVVADYARVSKGDLYSAYSDWAKTSGEHPVSKKKLGIRLLERGFNEDRTASGRFWVGLGLPADVLNGCGTRG